jgi:zinc/manganese transport system substrate-binding protein
MIVSLIRVLAALALAGAVVACGSGSSQDSGRPTVAATTGILAEITAEVAGPDATVRQVIPEGASPHDFQLSAQDRASIEDSVLLVHNGAGLEQGVPVDEIDVPRFALADDAGELLPLEQGVDPHIWMDPTRVVAALPALADALAEADPEHAGGYRRRARGYAAELTALDAELERRLASVPAPDRELVTSHDAMGYFADRYGFEVVATPFPASGAEAEATAAGIRDVEEAVRDARVPTLFAEQEDDPEVLELIADETGVAIVTGLLVESPGDGSYVEMLRTDAGLIAAGLAPQTAP